ncbi:MAG: hypothetical protein C4312_08005 [Thermoflexus sp.]
MDQRKPREKVHAAVVWRMEINAPAPNERHDFSQKRQEGTPGTSRPVGVALAADPCRSRWSGGGLGGVIEGTQPARNMLAIPEI